MRLEVKESPVQRTHQCCLIILLLLLVGCRSGNQRVTIQTAGMRFAEDEVHVKAGQPVTVQIINRDDYAHAFDIDEFKIHTTLAAKTTFETTLTPRQPGRYRFYCGAPGHAAAGMEGVLVVEP